MKTNTLLHMKGSTVRNTVLAMVLVAISYIPSNAFFCSAADSLALIEFYNKTNGASWTSSTNWLTGPVSTWQGVTVENDRVVSLVLPFNNLSGSLPYQLAFLQELKNLSLPGNQLTGGIPWEIIFLQKLQVLDLAENQLSGKITSKIGFLFNLQELKLQKNQFSGSIPSSIGLLNKLRVLDLSENTLSGFIPRSIGLLTSLEVLTLSNNQLAGSIPSSIGNLKKVTEVFLLNNKLKGAIPSSIKSMDSLVFLNVSNNDLTGAVPDSLQKLTQLFLLNISGNEISGLPNVSGISTLGQLRVSDNRLTFEDLEPNISKLRAPAFYVPQDSVGTVQSVTLCEGDTLKLSADFVGASVNNRYQWFRSPGGNVGANTNNPELVIANVQAANSGVYLARATNTVVRGLNIIRRPVTVTVQACAASAAVEPVSIVYPVPFTEEATVNLKTATTEELKVVVRDASGAVVESHTSKTNTDIKIGKGLTKPGTYYVDFLHNGKKETKRIVKQ
jgi:hypothetical protein